MNEALYNHPLYLISSCSCSVHFLLDRGIFNEERIEKGGQGNQNTQRKNSAELEDFSVL